MTAVFSREEELSRLLDGLQPEDILNSPVTPHCLGVHQLQLTHRRG